MAVANSIPDDRAIACLKYDIEPREISEKRFRDMAREMGYELESEKEAGDSPPNAASAPRVDLAVSRPRPNPLGVNRMERAWYFSPNGLGKRAFLAFVNAKGHCSMRVFDAED